MPSVSLETRLDAFLGGKTATALSRAFGMATVGDLLAHYPRRYARRGELTPIASLPIGENVTIVAEVRAVNVRPMRSAKATCSKSSSATAQGTFA